MALKEVCRLCKTMQRKTLSVFDQKMDSNVTDIILISTGVKIMETDEISQKVCVTCLQITIKMYKFRTTSMKNDQELKARHAHLKRHPLANKNATLKEKQLYKYRRAHPSIIKIIKNHPTVRLPDLAGSSHCDPYITLLKDEVDFWLKEQHYTQSEIEELKARGQQESIKFSATLPKNEATVKAPPVSVAAAAAVAAVNGVGYINGVRVVKGDLESAKRIKLSDESTGGPVWVKNPVKSPIKIVDCVTFRPAGKMEVNGPPAAGPVVKTKADPLEGHEYSKIQASAEKNASLKSMLDKDARKTIVSTSVSKPSPGDDAARNEIMRSLNLKELLVKPAEQAASKKDSMPVLTKATQDDGPINKSAAPVVFKTSKKSTSASFKRPSAANPDDKMPVLTKVGEAEGDAARRAFKRVRPCASSDDDDDYDNGAQEMNEVLSDSPSERDTLSYKLAAAKDTGPLLESLMVNNKMTSLHRCKICDTHFNSWKDLMTHEKKTHTTCQFCGARFRSTLAREEHLKFNCSIATMMSSLKEAKLELVRVDEVAKIRKAYASAFNAPIRHYQEDCVDNSSSKKRDSTKGNDEAGPSKPVTPSKSQFEIERVPKPGAQSPQITPKKNKAAENVICISDDESTTPTTARKQSRPVGRPAAGPKIAIVGNPHLEKVNMADDEASILKTIIKDVMKDAVPKTSQGKTGKLQPPSNNSIVEGETGNKFQILKNLRPHLNLYRIPVEIQYGEKLKLSYTYGKIAAPKKKRDYWYSLVPRDLRKFPETAKQTGVMTTYASANTPSQPISVANSAVTPQRFVVVANNNSSSNNHKTNNSSSNNKNIIPAQQQARRLAPKINQPQPVAPKINQTPQPASYNESFVLSLKSSGVPVTTSANGTAVVPSVTGSTFGNVTATSPAQQKEQQPRTLIISQPPAQQPPTFVAVTQPVVQQQSPTVMAISPSVCSIQQAPTLVAVPAQQPSPLVAVPRSAPSPVITAVPQVSNVTCSVATPPPQTIIVATTSSVVGQQQQVVFTNGDATAVQPTSVITQNITAPPVFSSELKLPTDTATIQTFIIPNSMFENAQRTMDALIPEQGSPPQIVISDVTSVQPETKIRVKNLSELS